MQAIVLTQPGTPGHFELQVLPEPALTPGTVRVRLRAAAFNPIDYQMRRGDPESALLRSPVLGREGAGIVEAVGPGVTGFVPGDAVFAYTGSLGSNGTYAEGVVLPEALLARMPARLSFEEAAALPLVGGTALQAIEKVAPAPEHRIFVPGGAGGVGSMLLRLLWTRGCRNLLTTAGSEASRAAIRSYGIPDDAIIDYRRDDVQGAVHARWGDAGADIVFDTVGGAYAAHGAALLRPHGTYADITFHVDADTRALLFSKGISIVSVSNYATATYGPPEAWSEYGARLATLAAAIEAGTIAPSPVEVVGTLSAETVATAHRRMEANESGGRKLVMSIR